MILNELAPNKGAVRKRKRLGRGVASGQGKTAGKGSKGQKARSGGKVRPGFEGGQMPIHRRLPKRGFKNIFKKIFAVINIDDLKRFSSGAVVDPQAVKAAGLAKGSWDGIKLLARGEIDMPLTIKLDHISAAARKKIEAAGGTIGEK